MHESPFPFADLALARRLERCEGKANAAFVEARARLSPETGATWFECGGAFAMFDGVGSPLTQTFGLGMLSVPSDGDLDRIESFFRERGSDVFHEMSPMAPPETMQRLVARGYRPIELTSVMVRPLVPSGAPAGDIQTRITGPAEVELWAETAARGWSEAPELSAFIRDLGRISASSEGTYPFLAELDGLPIGTGALAMHDGIALLAGASTIPEARNRGAQRALLEARLHFATENGAELAMMCAAPGSTSQRNAERRGFRILYTRIKFQLAGDPR